MARLLMSLCCNYTRHILDVDCNFEKAVSGQTTHVSNPTLRAFTLSVGHGDNYIGVVHIVNIVNNLVVDIDNTGMNILKKIYLTFS